MERKDLLDEYEKLSNEITFIKRNKPRIISNVRSQYLILERQVKIDRILNPKDEMPLERKYLLEELLSIKKELGYISGIQEEREKEYINKKYEKESLLKELYSYKRR